MNIFNTILTSIITSGIIGTLVSEYYQRKTLVKIMKRDFVIELFSNRFILNSGYIGDPTELNKSLGKIPIVFSDNKQVIEYYEKLFSGVSNENLLELIKAICTDKSVMIDISKWDDEMIMRALYINVDNNSEKCYKDTVW